MTEKDIAETLTQGRLVEGLDVAEAEVFAEYDDVYGEWNGSPSSEELTSRVGELEQALVALRVARQVLETVDVSDEVLQDVACSVPCEDASMESLEETVELVEDVLEKEDGGVSVPTGPSGPSI